MRRLFLMRHADAFIQDFIGEDFDRVLSSLGIEQAAKAGDFISSHYRIDKVITSPSNRTIQTISTVMGRCGSDDKIPLLPDTSSVTVHTLYSGRDSKAISEVEANYHLLPYRSSHTDVIQVISEASDSTQNLMILGHNPNIYKVALELADKNNELFDLLLLQGMKTATIVVLEFKELQHWQDIMQIKGEITALFTPEV